MKNTLTSHFSSGTPGSYTIIKAMKLTTFKGRLAKLAFTTIMITIYTWMFSSGGVTKTWRRCWTRSSGYKMSRLNHMNTTHRISDVFIFLLSLLIISIINVKNLLSLCKHNQNFHWVRSNSSTTLSILPLNASRSCKIYSSVVLIPINLIYSSYLYHFILRFGW